MSIAEDEAERVYPTRYWDGTHVKEKFYCDTDDLQEAYLRGREAPPSDVEVEAVAKKLWWWWDVDSDWEDVMPSDDCFSTLTPGLRAIYLRNARKLLEIARKAVNE